MLATEQSSAYVEAMNALNTPPSDVQCVYFPTGGKRAAAFRLLHQEMTLQFHVTDRCV